MPKSFLPHMAVLIFAVSYSGWVKAWGAEGHEAVYQIAYLELNSKAKRVVDSLIKEEKNDRFKSFHQGCGWPDHRGSAQSKRKKDHYINIPRDSSNVEAEECINTAKCLFTAIRKDISILKHRELSKKKKWQALKFLGHWMGDLHQPLHISFSDDRGGNDILLKKGIGCRKKLHDVWDNCIPEHLMKKMNVGKDRKKFGNLLHADISNTQRKKWLSTDTLAEWANESFEIARQSNVLYCFKKGKNCQYSNTDIIYESNSHSENGSQRILDIPASYETDHLDTVKIQIQKAGVRLGNLLNSVL